MSRAYATTFPTRAFSTAGSVVYTLRRVSQQLTVGVNDLLSTKYNVYTPNIPLTFFL